MSSEMTLAGGLVRVFRDGDRDCALYGRDIQEGVAGFGKTPVDAVKELFKGLGLDSEMRWFMRGEPEAYAGGGVWTSLASAIVHYEIDRHEAARKRCTKHCGHRRTEGHRPEGYCTLLGGRPKVVELRRRK